MKPKKNGHKPKVKPVAKSAATGKQPNEKSEVEALLESIQQSPNTETAVAEKVVPVEPTTPEHPAVTEVIESTAQPELPTPPITSMVAPDAPTIEATKQQASANKETIFWGTEALKKAFNKNGHEALVPFADALMDDVNKNKSACCELCSQTVAPREIEITPIVPIMVLLLYYLKMQRDSFPLATAHDMTRMLADVFGCDVTEPSISPQEVEATMKLAFAIGAVQKSQPDKEHPLMLYTIFQSGIEFVELERNPLLHWLVYNKEVLGFADKGKERLGKAFNAIINDAYESTTIQGKPVDAYTYFRTMAYNAVAKFCQTSINQ